MKNVGNNSSGVLLLHGLAATRLILTPLAADLRQAGLGPVLNWGYWTWRPGGIQAIAQRVTHRLHTAFPDGIPPLHLVGHSMGGLVHRQLLADGVIPSGGKYVSLATPHLGATRAGRMGDSLIYRLIYGSAGQDLRPNSSFLADLLQPPHAQSLCIYGGTGTDRGLAPSLPGDNDGTVESASAVLPDVASHRILAQHTQLPLRKETRRAVVAFLHGEAEG